MGQKTLFDYVLAAAINGAVTVHHSVKQDSEFECFCSHSMQFFTGEKLIQYVIVGIQGLRET